ncbi:DNA-3-methyladenine glycosylase [Conger conger]|uniref:DNA-3-methyladenine glycosylase n=1 Tax=Conger conger TaxID=82655 RepID=UPI002A5A02D8|nr:DNA-3-methyladenine glycosylase [Conger conger]XP_061079624.1 DNA-3-methyladenine glycosylase [Conger conger]XP_061079625.1 DNA-3-methyladenine glycosylase [Conger conger]XP_061079626.1 DNA-3-methyladenine glycosylase [Conger conger]
MPTRKRKLVAERQDGNGSESPPSMKATAPAAESIAETTFTSQYFSNERECYVRLGEKFFDQPCIRLAKAFLGKVLVRRCADGTELRGRVVETEAYLGGEDRASHSAGGRRTQRNAAMFMKPGTVYVYQIYGIYLCMNVSSQEEGAAVLLRSLEPLQGQEVMRGLRGARRREGSRPLKEKELCNGPSKLCQALDIPRHFDQRDLATDAEVWLEGREEEEEEEEEETPGVVSAPRIGIQSHGEWATKPLRFYLRGHPCVSVLDKQAERQTP